ncbi:MAG: hypothetical protein ACPGQL_08775 [Thermoplasmatota archaeon]
MAATARWAAAWIALALAASLMVVAPAQAGSEADPEIEDASGDQDYAALGFAGLDVIAGWMEKETNDTFVFVIQAAADVSSGTVTAYTYTFHVTYEGTEALLVATVDADGAATPSGDATAAETAGDKLLLTVAKSTFGSTVPGTNLTGLFIETSGSENVAGVVAISEDRAPDEGTGRDYVIGSQADPGVDFDADGLDDADEIALGTDPTDPDTDGDGSPDGEEIAKGTDPKDPDTDKDGVTDGTEVLLGTNGTNPDTDADGLTDGEEVALGTSPTDPDSDADGIPDEEEVEAGTDPTDADSDGDGLNDLEERDLGLNATSADTDGDGDSDGDEFAAGSDPNDASSTLASLEGGDETDWFVPLGIAALVLLLLLVILIPVLARRRADEEDAEGEEAEGEDGEPAWRREGEMPFLFTEAYLREGVSEDDLEDSVRRFNDRLARFEQERQQRRAAAARRRTE